jgi:putative FmdB family regulatory protein
MPVYDYLCTACDHRADILHGINDPGPNFCPSCGAEGTMRKQFSAPSIHFKGSGWAKKDRGSSSVTKAAAKGSATKAEPAAGSSEAPPPASTTSDPKD